MYPKHLAGILGVSWLLASVVPAVADYQKWGIVWNTSIPQIDAEGPGVAWPLSADGQSGAVAKASYRQGTWHSHAYVDNCSSYGEGDGGYESRTEGEGQATVTY